MSVTNESPNPRSKPPTPSSKGSATASPAPATPVSKEDNAPPTTSPSTITGASFRIVLFLALILFLLRNSISTFSSSESSLDSLVQFLKPLFDTSTTSSSSSSSTPAATSNSRSNKRRSSPSSSPFGVPLTKLYPPTAPMYERLKQQEELREQREQERRRRQEERKQNRSPFGDLFGTSNDDDDDSDYAGNASEACAGYYCAETNTCVDKPIHCPCPFESDTKCVRSDWYVCYRGPHSC
ncbi:hypothetical protein EDD21DRAFT_389675 [Dissophora ornata]|nr:hypothetical protein EDD21DRAFT_389675 [Dissophora ornata]